MTNEPSVTGSHDTLPENLTEGLHYVGKSEGDVFALFHYCADGKSDGSHSRPVLEVLVDDEDQIWVAAIPTKFTPFLGTMPQRTNGSAHRHPLNQLDVETAMDLSITGYVEPTTGICVASVLAYVHPRLATLMGRVYCPAKPLTVHDADAVQ